MTHYRGKRAFDLLTLAAVSVPSAVIGLTCALAIRLTSPGSILFRQERIGLDGRPFQIVKFRTMVEADDNPVFPTADRMTPVGRWLRRFSLDELPQLINVARGEMSIVGPRPTLRYQVARYDERQRRRLAVRPGITGLAQVRGRNALSWPERIELDLEYVERQSVLWDLKMLAWTVAIVIRGSGIGGHPTDDVLARPE
jgi:lipopolysaccharide/colanic/teichoic acid biosynthesis glycosyltransferase